MLTTFDVLDVNDPLQRAVDRLVAGSQQDFPVVEGTRPVGLLTRADLLVALQRSGSGSPVGAAIARDRPFAEAGEPLEDVLQRMREHRLAALPVVSDGRLVGVVTLENVSELLLVKEALKPRAGRA
jgi:CBS domain-containing protein